MAANFTTTPTGLIRLPDISAPQNFSSSSSSSSSSSQALTTHPEENNASNLSPSLSSSSSSSHDMQSIWDQAFEASEAFELIYPKERLLLRANTSINGWNTVLIRMSSILETSGAKGLNELLGTSSTNRFHPYRGASFFWLVVNEYSKISHSTLEETALNVILNQIMKIILKEIKQATPQNYFKGVELQAWKNNGCYSIDNPSRQTTFRIDLDASPYASNNPWKGMTIFHMLTLLSCTYHYKDSIIRPYDLPIFYAARAQELSKISIPMYRPICNDRTNLLEIANNANQNWLPAHFLNSANFDIYPLNYYSSFSQQCWSNYTREGVYVPTYNLSRKFPRNEFELGEKLNILFKHASKINLSQADLKAVNDLLEFLKQNNLSLSARNSQGRTVLQVACLSGNTDIIQAILAHPYTALKKYSAITMPDISGDTIFHIACKISEPEKRKRVLSTLISYLYKNWASKLFEYLVEPDVMGKTSLELLHEPGICPEEHIKVMSECINHIKQRVSYLILAWSPKDTIQEFKANKQFLRNAFSIQMLRKELMEVINDPSNQIMLTQSSIERLQSIPYNEIGFNPILGNTNFLPLLAKPSTIDPLLKAEYILSMGASIQKYHSAPENNEAINALVTSISFLFECASKSELDTIAKAKIETTILIQNSATRMSAILHARGPSNRTILQTACINTNLKLLELLFNRCGAQALSEAFNAQDDNGDTIFHLSCQIDNSDKRKLVLEMLLESTNQLKDNSEQEKVVLNALSSMNKNNKAALDVVIATMPTIHGRILHYTRVLRECELESALADSECNASKIAHLLSIEAISSNSATSEILWLTMRESIVRHDPKRFRRLLKVPAILEVAIKRNEHLIFEIFKEEILILEHVLTEEFEGYDTFMDHVLSEGINPIRSNNSRMSILACLYLLEADCNYISARRFIHLLSKFNMSNVSSLDNPFIFKFALGHDRIHQCRKLISAFIMRPTATFLKVIHAGDIEYSKWFVSIPETVLELDQLSGYPYEKETDEYIQNELLNLKKRLASPFSSPSHEKTFNQALIPGLQKTLTRLKSRLKRLISGDAHLSLTYLLGSGIIQKINPDGTDLKEIFLEIASMASEEFEERNFKCDINVDVNVDDALVASLDVIQSILKPSHISQDILRQPEQDKELSDLIKSEDYLKMCSNRIGFYHQLDYTIIDSTSLLPPLALIISEYLGFPIRRNHLNLTYSNPEKQAANRKRKEAIPAQGNLSLDANERISTAQQDENNKRKKLSSTNDNTSSSSSQISSDFNSNNHPNIVSLTNMSSSTTSFTPREDNSGTMQTEIANTLPVSFLHPLSTNLTSLASPQINNIVPTPIIPSYNQNNSSAFPSLPNVNLITALGIPQNNLGIMHSNSDNSNSSRASSPSTGNYIPTSLSSQENPPLLHAFTPYSENRNLGNDNNHDSSTSSIPMDKRQDENYVKTL